MNPKNFLLIGGLVLVLVAILGFVGVIGPTAEKSVFGASWWFDNGENWAHLIIGIVGLIGAFAFPMSLQRPVVMLLAIIGILIGIYSFFKQGFLGANLENPADSILHLVVGIWAFLSARGGKSMMASPMNNNMPGAGMNMPR